MCMIADIDNRSKVFGLGVNIWGQLGHNPEYTAVIDEIKEIKINCLKNDDHDVL